MSVPVRMWMKLPELIDTLWNVNEKKKQHKKKKRKN